MARVAQAPGVERVQMGGITIAHWTQGMHWRFGSSEEAEHSGFFTLERLRMHLDYNCGYERTCKSWRCLQCRFRSGNEWNPYLPESDDGGFNQAITTNRVVDADVPVARTVSYAGEAKSKIGKVHHKAISHWGKCAILPDHLELDCKDTQAEIQTVQIVIGTEL